MEKGTLWEYVGKQNPTAFARVDCDEDYSACMRVNVYQSPAYVLFFAGNKQEPLRYYGDYTDFNAEFVMELANANHDAATQKVCVSSPFLQWLCLS